MKKYTLITVVLALFLSFQQIIVCAKEMPFIHYNYAPDKKIVQGPSGYEVERVLYADGFGISNLKDPRDIFVDSNDNIFIADAGNNRIVKMNLITKKAEEYLTFKSGGKDEKLKGPQGIFVDKNGTMFIADTGNERLLIAGQDAVVKQIIVKPNTTLFRGGSKFSPQKVVVDPADRIYIKAEGIYEGLMEYNEYGEFIGYFASNPVKPTIAQLLWRRFMTKEQIARTEKFISVEYANVDIDEDGFIYATVYKQAEENIKRLNPSGSNVMLPLVYFETNYGDLSTTPTSASKLIDINYRNGYITALDNNKGRIFEYDNQGNLLFVFGSPGDMQGTFTSAVSIENIGDKLLVLDNIKNNITIFRRTEFGNLVKNAVDLYSKALYEEAIEPWKEVLKRDANYDLAYVGIGKAYYKMGNYKEAMNYYKLGSYKKGYSDAFKKYRQEFMKANFQWFVLGLGILIFANLGLAKYIRKRKLQNKKNIEGVNVYE